MAYRLRITIVSKAITKAGNYLSQNAQIKHKYIRSENFQYRRFRRFEGLTIV